jgi:hypothetical protein
MHGPRCVYDNTFATQIWAWNGSSLTRCSISIEPLGWVLMCACPHRPKRIVAAVSIGLGNLEWAKHISDTSLWMSRGDKIVRLAALVHLGWRRTQQPNMFF